MLKNTHAGLRRILKPIRAFKYSFFTREFSWSKNTRKPSCILANLAAGHGEMSMASQAFHSLTLALASESSAFHGLVPWWFCWEVWFRIYDHSILRLTLVHCSTFSKSTIQTFHSKVSFKKVHLFFAAEQGT